MQQPKLNAAVLVQDCALVHCLGCLAGCFLVDEAATAGLKVGTAMPPAALRLEGRAATGLAALGAPVLGAAVLALAVSVPEAP